MKPWETDETFLSRWLSGKLSEEELRAFEASPDYESYVATSKVLEPFEVSPYDEEAELGKILHRIKAHEPPKAQRISVNRNWYYAAAAAIVLVLVFVWQRFETAELTRELYAEEREQVELPDGSIIDLKEGSRLKYVENNWEENRAVYLEGEAYFEVEKGEKFEIQLKQGSVKILGTSFLIQEKPDTLNVICYTGIVEVEAFGHTNILKKGEKILTIKNKSPEQNRTALPQPLWLSDNIQLKEVPLEKVFQQLEEIYEIQIVGQYSPSYLFSGFFPTQDVSTALQQVLGPFNLEYEIDSESNVVSLK